MFAHAPHPGCQQQAGQSGAGDDQPGQQRCPWQFQAEQQTEQDAVVAVQADGDVGFRVAAALRHPRRGQAAEQGAGQQVRGADQDGECHQQAAAGVLLQEDLGEAAEQGAQAVQGRV